MLPHVTNFACSASAMTPDTRGADALVPVNLSVQMAVPNVDVVWGPNMSVRLATAP